MIKAGVVIDSWKLAIFKKLLDERQYSYTEHPGPMKDTLTLQVMTFSAAALQPTIERANAECAKWKRKQKLN